MLFPATDPLATRPTQRAVRRPQTLSKLPSGYCVDPESPCVVKTTLNPNLAKCLRAVVRRRPTRRRGRLRAHDCSGSWPPAAPVVDVPAPPPCPAPRLPSVSRFPPGLPTPLRDTRGTPIWLCGTRTTEPYRCSPCVPDSPPAF